MDANGFSYGEDAIRRELHALAIKEEPEPSASDLLERCETLCDELDQFQQYLVEHKKDKDVELRHFRNSVQAELKLIQKLSRADRSAERTAHTLRSSNLPFYSAVWDAAKRSTEVTALEKRFYWDASQGKTPGTPDEPNASNSTGRKATSAIVDVVAQDGREWIKVSTLTEKRILFDMAKAGWVEDSSDDETEDVVGPEDDEPEGLLKQAEVLLKASKATRIRYQHPSICLVLPRIKNGGSHVIDNLLSKIQAMGIKIETSNEIPETPILSADILSHLVVDPFSRFSNVLNVDCTILLALVSDLSYSRVEKQDWHHRAVQRQIEMETQDNLLPNSLWPACGSRILLCTREAAVRMQEIVDIIGTDSEKKRANCILESTEFQPREERIAVLQELSAYSIPRDWQIPIVVVDVDFEDVRSRLPPVAEDLAKHLSIINQSVFLYGWASGLTTISSNRTVAKEIEAIVEAHRASDEDRGPDIWLSPASRSLVGKEKTRRNWNS